MSEMRRARPVGSSTVAAGHRINAHGNNPFDAGCPYCTSPADDIGPRLTKPGSFPDTPAPHTILSSVSFLSEQQREATLFFREREHEYGVAAVAKRSRTAWFICF